MGTPRLEQTDATRAAQITPAEESAIVDLWKGGSMIPAEDALTILDEIRARKAEIEESVVKMAARATSEIRRVPRRHQQFAFLILASIIAAAALVMVTYKLIEGK